MTANAWWTFFTNWAMVVSTFDAFPVRFLFDILVINVCALFLMHSGVSACCVRDIVLCSGAVVLIIGLCLFFLILCLATTDFSTLGTTGVDIVDNCWVGCVIDLV